MRLSGVLGQERARLRLEADLNAGRLAHAYLFVGPQGVGRGTTARALFVAANCAERHGEEPCGQCAACRRLSHTGHEDFLELAPPSGQASAQIKKEAVQEVIRTLGTFAPFAGGTRVVLIREAGQLNPHSANALLKTLEEPPPGNVLILTAQDTRELLPTLVSRCRRVNFSPLDQALITDALVGQGLDPAAARLRAGLAAGSLGRAQDLDQDKLAADLERLVSQVANDAGPLNDWRFAEELVREHRAEVIDRQGLARVLDLLALRLRDLAVISSGRPSAALLPTQDALAGWDLDQASQAFEAVRRAQSQIIANASPELTLVVMLSACRRRQRRRTAAGVGG